MLWTRYFIEEQGYKLEESVLNQDNVDTLLLTTNRKETNSKRTSHNNMLYSLTKDRIGADEITLKHCPTDKMMGGHFTKPMQGNQFRKLRSEIQGIPEDTPDALMGWDQPCIGNTTYSKHASPSPQECVGTQKDRTNAGTSKGAVSLHADAEILHADGKVLDPPDVVPVGAMSVC
jgi:hypothetical protein